MDNENVTQYRSWFSRFVQEHATRNEQDQRNILLKEEHTMGVYANTRRIAAGIGLDAQASVLAEVIALFHDVGRFPQYVRYRTFEDSRSVNHAVLGAKVLLERNVLSGLSVRERSLIVRTVALHNVFLLPSRLDDEVRLYTKIVRDADKLDIWRIFIELSDRDATNWPSAAGLGLPDTRAYSPEVLASLERREMVRLTSLRTLNDFRLLQLAWIYDLNFAPSLRMVLERNVIERLTVSIPQTADILRAKDNLRNYLIERLDAVLAPGESRSERIPRAGLASDENR
jgi:hypothetical protein